MANEPFPLLKRLKVGSYENCVIITYNADLYFFEQVVLPTLRSHGCNNNLVVMDLRQYEASLLSGGNHLASLGKTYSVWPVSVPGAFHPKLILQSGQQNGRLILGSGNLTVRGFSSNWELFTEIPRSGDGDNDHLFQEVWSFVRSVSESVVGAAESQLRQVEETSNWLLGTTQPAGWPRVLVGRPGAPSIVSQLRELIGGSKVRRIVVISPFFDPRLQAVQELADALKPDQLWLVVQRDTVSLPGKLATTMKSLRVVEFEAPQKEKSVEAYLHAKAYIIETEAGDFCLWGSPNCSSAALVASTNVELAILQTGKRGEFARKLNLSSSLKKGRCIDPSSLTARADDSTNEEGAFRLVGAEVVNDTVHVLLADESFKPHLRAGRLVFFSGNQLVEQADAKRESERVFSTQLALPQGKGTILCRLVLVDGNTEITSAPAAVHFAADIARATPSRRSSDLDQISRAIQSGTADWAKGLEQVCELLFKIETSVSAEDTRLPKAGVAHKKSASDDPTSEIPEEIKDYGYFVGIGHSAGGRSRSIASILLEDLLGALTAQMQRGLEQNGDDVEAVDRELRRYQEEADSGSAEGGGKVTFDLAMDSDDALRVSKRLRNCYRRLMKGLCSRFENLRENKSEITGDEMWRLGAVNLLLINGCDRELDSTPSVGPVLVAEDILADYLPAIEIVLGRVRVLANSGSGPLVMQAAFDPTDQHLRRSAGTTSLLLAALIEARRQWLTKPEFIRGKDSRTSPSYLAEIVAARSYSTLIQLGLLPTTEEFAAVLEETMPRSNWMTLLGTTTLQKSYQELTRRARIIEKAEDSFDASHPPTPVNTLKEGMWVCSPSTGVTEISKVSGHNVELARIGGSNEDKGVVKVAGRIVVPTGLCRKL